MPQSIFDWDEEEAEEKPSEPVALIPYQPEPVRFERESANDHPDLSHQPPERSDPVPFEYHSDPFQPQPEPDPFGYQAESFEHRQDTFDQDRGHFSDPVNTSPYDYDPFANEAASFDPPPVDYQQPTREETSRRSGLAFSAGIVFFSSVVFMLFLGWIADWLIGSSPWGLVGGIVLGSIIGLIQFVRITSQIFNSKKSEAAIHPLMPPDDDR